MATHVPQPVIRFFVFAGVDMGRERLYCRELVEVTDIRIMGDGRVDWSLARDDVSKFELTSA